MEFIHMWIISTGTFNFLHISTFLWITLAAVFSGPLLKWFCQQNHPTRFCWKITPPKKTCDLTWALNNVNSCGGSKKSQVSLVLKIENSSCPNKILNDFYGRVRRVFFDIPPKKTNMSPENWWLEDEMSFWDGPYFRGHSFIFGGVPLETFRFGAPKCFINTIKASKVSRCFFCFPT